MVLLDGNSVSSSRELELLYRSRLSSFGLTARLFFYQREEQHALKLALFGELLSVLRLRSGTRILDIGCGYGALLEHFAPSCRYEGIDLVPEFIEEAKRRFPAYEFRIADVLVDDCPPADICLLAGVLSSVPAPTELLDRALDLSSTAVLFDITLDERLQPDYQDLNRWTLDQVSATVKQHDYTDITVLDVGASWVLVVAHRGQSPLTLPSAASAAIHPRFPRELRSYQL